MRGRNIGRARFRRALDAGGHHHAVFIDRDRDKVTACSRKDISCQPVTWFFEPNGASRSQQNTRRDLERLLRAGDNHHLVRLALNRPRGAKVSTDSFAKRFRAERIDIVD